MSVTTFFVQSLWHPLLMPRRRSSPRRSPSHSPRGPTLAELLDSLSPSLSEFSMESRDMDDLVAGLRFPLLPASDSDLNARVADGPVIALTDVLPELTRRRPSPVRRKKKKSKPSLSPRKLKRLKSIR